MKYSRVSSHWFSLTSPLWAKHFWQIKAYRDAVELTDESSSPKMASASLSYHCLRGGGTGLCGDAKYECVNHEKAFENPSGTYGRVGSGELAKPVLGFAD